MATYLLFGRRAYADPLAHVGEVEGDAPPALEDLGAQGEGWLELVVVPADDVLWILQDGELVVEVPA